jgi:hypothetical protein
MFGFLRNLPESEYLSVASKLGLGSAVYARRLREVTTTYSR